MQESDLRRGRVQGPYVPASFYYLFLVKVPGRSAQNAQNQHVLLDPRRNAA